MKRFIRFGVGRSVVWAALLMFAYLASHGEPICTGPLILEVNESYPPQCDDRHQQRQDAVALRQRALQPL